MALMETELFHFSSPAEYPLAIATFTDEPTEVSAVVTNGVNEALQKIGQASFMLMGRKQSDTVVTIHSREHADYQPQLTVTLEDGQSHTFSPVKDTTICGGDHGAENYGEKTTLCVQSKENPVSSGTDCDVPENRG